MPHLLKRIAWLVPLCWLGCSHPEPSIKPLGLGPFALAEQKTRTQALSLDTARHRESAPSDAPYASDDAPVKPGPSAAPSSSAKTEHNNADVETVDAGVANGKPTLEDWLGLYQGSDVTRYVMEGQPDRNFDDSKAKIRVERGTEARLSFVFVDSSNGQDLCTMLGDFAGNEAKLLPGQRCFIEPDEGMTVRSRPGRAKRDGNKLTLNVILDTSLELEDVKADGRIEYEFEGTKR